MRWTTDMRQETLFRGLVDCFLALGWVPWVLVFDHMKTVTSGRDGANQPIWPPALLHLAGEFGFHPQACDPGAGNQKGSVESLVKWVKGNFLPGRSFADDPDLHAQATAWTTQANTRPSTATGEPPLVRLPREAAQGGGLPPTAQDYGRLEHGRVSADALVAIAGNRYAVPIAHVGVPVTVRFHQDRVRIWRDTACIADHPRAPDGAHQRVIDVTHFATLVPTKRRAQVMLYREALLGLGGRAPAFLSELCRRWRAQLAPEILAVYTLYEPHGAAAVRAAMEVAEQAGTSSAAALEALLPPGPLPQPCAVCSACALTDGPEQVEVDRLLSHYEAWVQIDDAWLDAPSVAAACSSGEEAPR